MYGLAGKRPVKNSSTYLFALYEVISLQAVQNFLDIRERDAGLDGKLLDLLIVEGSFLYESTHTESWKILSILSRFSS